MNLDIRRQDLTVQFLRFCLNSFQDGLCLFPTQHQNDALDRIVILLEAEFTQARCVPDHYISYIAHSDRHPLVGANDDVSNVIGVAHQSDAAHVVELTALRIESAAGIRVIGGERRHHLRNGQVISVDARRVEQHLVLHHRSTKTRVVGYAVHRSIGPLHHPILERL